MFINILDKHFQTFAMVFLHYSSKLCLVNSVLRLPVVRMLSLQSKVNQLYQARLIKDISYLFYVILPLMNLLFLGLIMFARVFITQHGIIGRL